VKIKSFESQKTFREGAQDRLLHRRFGVRSGRLVFDVHVGFILHALPGVTVLLLVVTVLTVRRDHLNRSVYRTGNLASSTKVHPEHVRDLRHAVEVPPLPLKRVALHSSYLPLDTDNSGLQRLPLEAQTLPFIAQAAMLVDDLEYELVKKQVKLVPKKRTREDLPCP